MVLTYLDLRAINFALVLSQLAHTTGLVCPDSNGVLGTLHILPLGLALPGATPSTGARDNCNGGGGPHWQWAHSMMATATATAGETPR